MSGWNIDSADETEIIASKPQTSPHDIGALLRFLSKELKVSEGYLEPGGHAGGINSERVTPVRGYEKPFADAVKAYNASKPK